MANPAHLGDALESCARLFPDRIGARDLERAMTFRLWNDRASRLANALRGIGLSKGDRICVLAYNCLEWLEIYAKGRPYRDPDQFPTPRSGDSVHRRRLRG